MKQTEVFVSGELMNHAAKIHWNLFVIAAELLKCKAIRFLNGDKQFPKGRSN